MNQDKSRHKNSYKIIGQNIRNIRVQNNLTQEELAYNISSARNYIGCIERAEKVPSLAIILDVKKALKCDIRDFFIGL